jgi:hypothetical protein
MGLKRGESDCLIWANAVISKPKRSKNEDI